MGELLGRLADVPPEHREPFRQLVRAWNEKVDREQNGNNPGDLHSPPALRMFMQTLTYGECLGDMSELPEFETEEEQSYFIAWFLGTVSALTVAVYELAQECYLEKSLRADNMPPCDCRNIVTDVALEEFLDGTGPVPPMG